MIIDNKESSLTLTAQNLLMMTWTIRTLLE